MLRLLTVVPQLRKVVAAFVHAVPGLSGVIVVMAIFFYTMALIATFTILNPFFGIIVSTMQELQSLPDPSGRRFEENLIPDGGRSLRAACAH